MDCTTAAGPGGLPFATTPWDRSASNRVPDLGSAGATQAATVCAASSSQKHNPATQSSISKVWRRGKPAGTVYAMSSYASKSSRCSSVFRS